MHARTYARTHAHAHTHTHTHTCTRERAHTHTLTWGFRCYLQPPNVEGYSCDSGDTDTDGDAGENTPGSARLRAGADAGENEDEHTSSWTTSPSPPLQPPQPESSTRHALQRRCNFAGCEVLTQTGSNPARPSCRSSAALFANRQTSSSRGRRIWVAGECPALPCNRRPRCRSPRCPRH